MPTNTKRSVVPQAMAALDKMKYEVANEFNVNLKQGYNGDLTSREAGTVGGNMVRKMVEEYQKNMIGQ